MVATDHLGTQFAGGCDWGGCPQPATALRAESNEQMLPAPIRQFCHDHAARFDAAENA